MAMEERMTAAWLARRSETALFQAEQVRLERIPCSTRRVPVVPVVYPSEYSLQPSVRPPPVEYS
jgi:hypothetical protein